MTQLIECVPNFSEGRNQSIVNEIAGEISKVQGVRLLGLEMDYDHNRSVLTCIGTPDSVVSAVYNACVKATELIDLRKHHGVHPRIGATDVIPLIPLVNSSILQCIDLAEKLGDRIANTLGVPVFFYGFAAKKPENRTLSNIRRGEFEQMRQILFLNSNSGPDIGPSQIHTSAGAVAVGVRDLLIAFNINLQSTDIKLARHIAREIRESNNGLPGIKALGLKLDREKCVQVSMNITDYKKTSISDAFQEIEIQAHKLGVEILESELIGLAPENAFGKTSLKDLKLKNMTPDRYLDAHIRSVINNNISC